MLARVVGSLVAAVVCMVSQRVFPSFPSSPLLSILPAAADNFTQPDRDHRRRHRVSDATHVTTRLLKVGDSSGTHNVARPPTTTTGTTAYEW